MPLASPPPWDSSRKVRLCKSEQEPSWVPAGPTLVFQELRASLAGSPHQAACQHQVSPTSDLIRTHCLRLPCCQHRLAGPGLSLIYIRLGCLETPSVAFGPWTLFSRKRLPHQHPFQSGAGPEGLAGPGSAASQLCGLGQVTCCLWGFNFSHAKWESRNLS